jgi:predicted small integral membrane protein
MSNILFVVAMVGIGLTHYAPARSRRAYITLAVFLAGIAAWTLIDWLRGGEPRHGIAAFACTFLLGGFAAFVNPIRRK